jgi:hypothetical protein
MPLLMLRENQKIIFFKEEENNSVKSQKPKINTRKRLRI